MMIPAQSHTAPQFERKCIGCGYLLRGLPSNRCPECGREFEPNANYPNWAAKYFLSIKSSAPLARKTMIWLLVIEAVLVMPVHWALMIWLIIYARVGFPSWWHIWRRQNLSRTYGIAGFDTSSDQMMFHSTRKWLYGVLLLTIFQVPQISAVAFDLPWLYFKAHEMYEVEPFLGPHDFWMWSGVSPVWDISLRGSGAYFNLGMRRMAYCAVLPSPGSGGEWHHMFGPWWYWEVMEMW